MLGIQMIHQTSLQLPETTNMNIDGCTFSILRETLNLFTLIIIFLVITASQREKNTFQSSTCVNIPCIYFASFFVPLLPYIFYISFIHSTVKSPFSRTTTYTQKRQSLFLKGLKMQWRMHKLPIPRQSDTCYNKSMNKAQWNSRVPGNSGRAS